ncbi:MAG: glycosyltransferase [Candidatus Latescibacteria bacterium]|nr:glycosyltransferase [bacterium]MBD3423284.1 glycosyltransferase [Candidatus Latescibacterota bacterium]
MDYQDYRKGRPRVLQLAGSVIATRHLLIPLMRRLRDCGYIVEAAASGDNRQAVNDITEEGFRFHRIGIKRNISLLNLAGSFFRIYRLLKREDFDIVHLHTPIAAFVGRFAARLAGVEKIIYTAHGFYFHENMNPVLRLFHQFLEFMAGRLATDLLFCQSMEDAETARYLRFLNPDRIIWIGNGVDTGRFVPDISLGSGLRKEIGIAPGSTVITFIGRTVREKGIVDLIHSYSSIMARFSESVLVVVGDSKTAGDRPDGVIEMLKHFVESENLGKRIIFLGFRKDIHRIMAATDIFVLPSYREGFPRTICEAMSCGVPVIATDIRGCREAVDHSETGLLFNPGSRSELSKALEDLLTHRGIRIRMGENGRKKAERELSEKRVLETQLEIYNNLAPAERYITAGLAEPSKETELVSG